MKPRFVTKWAVSECGKWEIELERNSPTYRLLEYRTFATFVSGTKSDKAWVVVGEFETEKEAVADAERRSLLRGAA